MAASGVAKCTRSSGAGVVEPGPGGDGREDGSDDGADEDADDEAEEDADEGTEDGVGAGGVVADPVGVGATPVLRAAVAGRERPSPQPAAARTSARPAATRSNERWVGANAVDVIGGPLSAGSGAARNGRPK